MGHAVRKIAAPPQAVDAMFRQAGVIQVDTLDEMFDVAQLVAHQPLPRGRRVAIVGNSDALGLLAADAAAAVGLVVNKSVALGADASAEDFEDALDAAIDDPEVDSVVAVYIPPLNVSGEDVANVLAAVGEQSDKPLVSTFLGAEGVPGAAPRARRRRLHGRPRVGAVVPRAWRRRCAPSRGSSSTPCGCGTPDGPPVEPADVDTRRRQAARQRAADASTPRAPTSTRTSLTALLGAYGIELWQTRPVTTAQGGARGRARRSAGTSCSRRPPSTCASGPTSPTCWRNIDNAAEMRDAWDVAHRADHRARARPGSSSRRTPTPGVPVAIREHGGPAVRAGGVVRDLRAADRAARPTAPTGSRRSGSGTRRPWCARSSRRRCCSATAAARSSTSPSRAADPPGRAAPERPAAGQPAATSRWCSPAPTGATVLTAAARVDPVVDPRSDWFVRRMTTPGDTLPTDAR